MKNMRLSAKLYLVLGILTLTAIIIVGVGIYGIRNINEMLSYQNNFTIAEMGYLGEVQFNLMDMVRKEKNAALSHDENS